MILTTAEKVSKQSAEVLQTAASTILAVGPPALQVTIHWLF
jgi:hypothetical protein